MEPVIVERNISLPRSLRKLTSVLFQYGYVLYLVGGAVRDALQGEEPHDWDVATETEPDEIIRALSHHPHYQVLEVGKAFGVLTVVTPEKHEYQIATFRKDLSAGRRPDAVEFTTMEFDACRRDLTINALFYDMTNHKVYDFVGGIADLETGLVRTVGAPAERFSEDRLRILRAVRFGCKPWSKLEDKTAQAIKADPRLSNGVNPVSPERVRNEFLSALGSCCYPTVLLETYESLGLLEQMFPGFEKIKSSNFIASRRVDFQLFSLLEKNDPKKVVSLLKKLSYSNDEVALVEFWFEFRNLSYANVVRLKRKAVALGMNGYCERLFAQVFCGEVCPGLNIDMVDCFSHYMLTVSGDDLLKEGFQGKALGQELENREKMIFTQMFVNAEIARITKNCL